MRDTDAFRENRTQLVKAPLCRIEYRRIECPGSRGPLLHRLLAQSETVRSPPTAPTEHPAAALLPGFPAAGTALLKSLVPRNKGLGLEQVTPTPNPMMFLAKLPLVAEFEARPTLTLALRMPLF